DVLPPLFNVARSFNSLARFRKTRLGSVRRRVPGGDNITSWLVPNGGTNRSAAGGSMPEQFQEQLARAAGAYRDMEQQLLLAYVHLHTDRTGARTASLARFGNYEVRLLDVAGAARPLWIELYDHEFQSGLGGYAWSRLSKLGEAAAAAQQLIAKARQLDG